MITSSFENNPSGKLSPAIQHFDSEGRLLSSQRKSFLVPVGEYLPEILDFLMGISGNSESAQSHKQYRQYIRGRTAEKPISIEKTNIGALVCSGVLSPDMYRDLTKQGAEILTNSAALDIFAKSNLYYNQTQDIVRFHAIANARPFVHSAIGGDSYIITAQGNFLAYSQPREIAYKTAHVTPSSSLTFYSKMGEYFIPLSSILLACVILSKKLVRRRNSGN